MTSVRLDHIKIKIPCPIPGESMAPIRESHGLDLEGTQTEDMRRIHDLMDVYLGTLGTIERPRKEYSLEE